MALTSEEETKVKAIIAAFDGAKQVSDLPAADMTATDKQIEVYDKKSGTAQQMSLKDAVDMGQNLWCGRVWNLDNATPQAATYVGSLELLRELPIQLGLGCYLVKNDHSRRKLRRGCKVRRIRGTLPVGMEPQVLSGFQDCRPSVLYDGRTDSYQRRIQLHNPYRLTFCLWPCHFRAQHRSPR